MTTITKKSFFNPLASIPDRWQLAISVSILVLSILFNYKTGMIDDGVFHTTFQSHTSWPLLIISGIIIVLLPTILLCISGKVFYKRTRLVDMWNAVLFSRLPILIYNIIFAACVDKNALNQLAENGNLKDISAVSFLALIGLLGIPFIVYSFVILVNGYKTAMYAKKPIHYVIMVTALLLSEFIYRLFIFPMLIQYLN
ncbi:MAG: hypothetical protein DI598_09430 [Pseudopedobacter saltans]|uniref:Yip1 domain-containing protein n=1 Tax=Pseudopedobacter saltans TaxID=151895 RepID=A0A2W5H465_9SPHI|nr:MAG: hypothetical protein DI598_09430 [Pseudopedobacter saltans]